MANKAKIGLLDFNDEREHVLKETFRNAQGLKKNVVRTLERVGGMKIVDSAKSFSGFDKMVGATGFEPVASCAPCKCAKPDCATPRSKYLVLLPTLFLGWLGRLNVLFLFFLTLLWLP